MAHIGHSLIGDGKYGVNRDDKTKGYKYQALYSYRLIFDFGRDEGYLGYLSGKQVHLDPEDIWFVADYQGASEKVRKIIG
jgi:23S rRNA pseudouridine955/2504/2580 synthase